ncbi:hypothetical protein ACQR5T_09675 [Xanthomonas oryzae pv. oryzicola]|uniref:hypothetical protein n=1 Tax=Xanthomonas oryzae TaxID=347 RepID=UPI0003F9178D|nr:hypothetical protein [Xanthomonas oryzae]AKO05979.1 hypothetical protein ACU16_19635 [Xanthomonas oryzae pv. oryzicola]AKO09893.1 hypothetical protein ACU17_19640 [Xanthomonas oryzae pv. oryzicola]OWB24479.1 hypothetical protein XocBAI20_17950 [Xanthomonas oryzae pv. oryzicola]
MTLLSKSQILAANDRKIEDLDITEWGGTVRISTMSASDRDQWEQDTYGGEKTKMEDFRARFVALCLVDDKGARLFTDKEVGQLGAKSASALDRVFRAAQKLNALGDAAIEAMEKKS